MALTPLNLWDASDFGRIVFSALILGFFSGTPMLSLLLQAKRFDSCFATGRDMWHLYGANSANVKCLRADALGERGGAHWLRGGCHVASGVAHQNGKAKTEQQLVNTFFWLFEYFNFLSSDLHIHEPAMDFSRQRCKRAPFTLLHHMRCVGDEGAAL